MPQLPQSLTIYRQEIIEIQKSRADLMKWKLILVGGFAAFGLEKFPAILALIPFVCVYVDALCYQQSIKVFVISKFISERRQRNLHMDVEYERLCQLLNKSFSLEDIALFWSSFVLCILTPFYVLFIKDKPPIPTIPISVVVIVSIIGVVTSICVFCFYSQKVSELDREPTFSSVCTRVYSVLQRGRTRTERRKLTHI